MRNSKCPTCHSDDPKKCHGDRGMGRPHRLGKWAYCCKDLWHTGSLGRFLDQLEGMLREDGYTDANVVLQKLNEVRNAS